MTVNVLETACNFLLCFSFATLLGPYKAAWLPMGAVTALGIISSVLLQRLRGRMWARLLCGLLPALGLLAAGSFAELVITAVVLVFYFILTMAGKNEIRYEDYKYWFGIPAVFAGVVFIVCLTRWPIRPASTALSAAYLFFGVLTLREKRMGRDPDVKLRLLRMSEPVAAVAAAAISGTLVYAALRVSFRILTLPVAYLLRPLISLFELLSGLIVKQAPEELTEPPTTEAVTDEAMLTPPLPSAEPGITSDYAWLTVLIRGLLIFLVLAVLVYVFYRFGRMLRHIRAQEDDGDGTALEYGREQSRSRRARRRNRRKNDNISNNEKIRQIYREYLLFMRGRGVRIARQTTSEDVMAASAALAAPDESQQLRALYIRARYQDAREMSDGQVLQAEALLTAIKEKISAEDGRP